MKAILFVITLIALTVQTFGQKASIIGEWKFGKGFSLYYSYNFDSLGIVKFSVSGCTGRTLSIGNYCIKEDSIIINYYPGYYEYINGDVEIYRTDSSKLEWDTLFILDQHTIQVHEYLYINNIDLPDRITFEDSIFCADQYIQTKEILFDSVSGYILPESFKLLDSMALFLNKNRSIGLKIERWEYSPKLEGDPIMSQIQVELIGDYLERKGINRKRLNLEGNEFYLTYLLTNEIDNLTNVYDIIFNSIWRAFVNQEMRSQTIFSIETINFKYN
ncbi:MAG TPA: hypothetical protein PLD02_01560 [Saprospiraceae bacterium]|nr:hypothetical protein [Saprospiraceae bacterium]